MQTIYYTTRSFIRHQGNLVDLAAYRQKLAAVSGGDWVEREEAELTEAEPAPVLTLVPQLSQGERNARRRRRSVRRAGICLDLAASLAVVVLTLSAAAAFLRL